LWLGNLEFDSTSLTDNTGCTTKEVKVLTYVAQLLGVNSSKLLTVLVLKSRNVGKQFI
jgi:myosin heavy subunit